MYRHEEIINKLTIQQKLSILADVRGFADSSVLEQGVPSVKVAKLEDLNAERNNEFPSFEVLANSWDLKLIENVSKNLCAGVKDENINLFVTPKANVANSVYEKGLSEDPYLCGRLVDSCVKAVNSTGAMPCVQALSLSDTTIEYSDNELNKAALNNYYVKPFEVVARNNTRFAMQIAEDGSEGKYANANSEMLAALEKNSKKTFYQVFGTSSAENAILNVKSQASIIIRGSYGALQNAYDKYLKLKAEVESGMMDESELEHAIRSGTAISEEMINDSVDKALTFAYACSIPGQELREIEGYKPKVEVVQEEGEEAPVEQPVAKVETPINVKDPDYFQTGSLCYNSVIKSAVLLKNARQNALPIKRGKVAVIGHLAVKGVEEGKKTILNALTERKELSVCGYAQGYDLSADRSDSLIPEAANLAKKADYCVVFLGTDARANSKIKNSRSVKLPANQLALLDVLSKQGKPIIAIVSSVYALDMRFESKCVAVLLASVDASKSADAIADMICGRANPSGKLSCTRYVNAEERFDRIKNDKQLGKIKIGDMVGYRGYVTNKESIRYPFGFGLSYTSFAYSNCSISGKRLLFTIKNVGSYDGEEVVQIYASAKGSNMIRPARFLVGFVRVPLRRGESKQVVVNLDSATATSGRLTVEVEKFNFETYNFATGNSEAEGCYFDFYIGSNVNEVRKVGNIYNNGKKLNNGGEKITDYVTTVSNVVADGYTVEKTTPKPVPVKHGTGASVFTVLSIVADVLLLMLAILSATSGLDMITFNPNKSGFAVTIGAIVVVNTVLVIALLRKARVAALKDHVSIPHVQPSSHDSLEMYDALFMREFSEEELTEEEEEDKTDDYAAYFDSSINMPMLSQRLVEYAGAYGLKINSKMAVATISALSSSRLVFLHCKDQEKSTLFTQVISSFFESPYFIYSVNNDYYTTDSLLYARSSADGFVETPVLNAINNAIEDPHKVKVVYIKDILAENTSTYLSKCLRYVHNPLKAYKISVDKKITGATCTIPSNVWFVVCLAEGEIIADLPANVADSAAFINLNAEIVEPVESNVNLHAVSYHQFVDMSETCRGRKQINEGFWKKVDKFTEYVQTFNETFEITNRSWLQIEKYAGVSLTCGTEEEDVLDMVLATKIVPAALPVIRSSNQENDLTVAHAVEEFFGEKVVNNTLEIIKESGVYDEKKPVEELSHDFN